MKRNLVAVVAASALLVSCSGSMPRSSTAPETVQAKAGTTAKANQPAAKPRKAQQSPAQHEKPKQEQPAPASDSKCGVTVDSAGTTKDYDGKPALMVELTFTNKSDETASYMLACFSKAFQDGVELDRAMVMGDDLSGNNSKDVKPGVSLKVRDHFELTSKSKVEFSVKEALSFDDKVIVDKVIEVR